MYQISIHNSIVRNIDGILVNSRFGAAKQFLSVPSCALMWKRFHKCDACRNDHDLRLSVILGRSAAGGGAAGVRRRARKAAGGGIFSETSYL